MRFRALILAAALLTVNLVAFGACAQSPAPGDVLTAIQYQTAVLAEERGDSSLVMLSLQTAMSDDMYPQLSEERSFEVARLYAEAAYRQGLWSEAHRGYVKATANPKAPGHFWSLRWTTATMAGDGADADQTFRHMVDQSVSPDRVAVALASKKKELLYVLSNTSGDELIRFDQLLTALPEPREARLRLGAQMERENWTPYRAYEDASVVWLHYIEALMAKGDTEHAKRVGARITDPMIMMAMHADRRFDPIIAAHPTLGDPQGAAERNLQSAREYVEDYPRMLDGRIALIRMLSILNRHDEAFEVAEDANRAVGMSSPMQPAFDDLQMTFGLQVMRSSELMSRGRIDEAVGSRTSAVSRCSCGASAVIGLTRLLLEADRAKEAQAWLQRPPGEGASLHDHMELNRIQACVSARLDDQPGLENALVFLRSHESWRPEALVGALICADRMSEAAKALTGQIQAPGSRLQALSSLQTYAGPRSSSAYGRMIETRWSALRSDPAVTAAASKVGRQGSYRLEQFQSAS